MRLHADPAVRASLPPIGRFLRWYVVVAVLVAAIVIVSAAVDGAAALAIAALAPLPPIATEVYLGLRLWRHGEGWLTRYWRSMTLGVALCGCAFAVLAVSRVLPSDVPLALQGIAVPSAALFILYALWIRLQATRGHASTVGFFDVAIVVTSLLTYLGFFFTAPYVSRGGPEGVLGVVALAACATMLGFVLVLVGRRPRTDGVSAEQVLAISIGVAVAGTAVAFVWSFLSGRGAIEAAPPWFFGAGWAVAFGVGALSPFAETLRRSGPDEVTASIRVRPYWPYVVLAVTSPLVIWAVAFGGEEEALPALVGLFLVVEVLVARQLVLIGAQRAARQRQRALKDVAAAEAARTNVLLDLALSLSVLDDAGAMCEAVATAVPGLVGTDALLVMARQHATASQITASLRGERRGDPATVWQTLEQLDLSGARPVQVGPAWAGLDGDADVVVAAVITSGGERLGYLVVAPTAAPGPATFTVLEGVVHQLALALDRSALVEDVRVEEARVREVVDRLEEGVADLDPNRVVRACNAAFAAFVDADVDAVTGRPFPPRVLALVDSARLVDELQGGTVVSEAELTMPSGARKEFEFTIVPRRSEDGSTIEGVLVVARDVAYERRERRELLRLLDDLVHAAADTPARPRDAAAAAALAGEIEAGPLTCLRDLARRIAGLGRGEPAGEIVADLRSCTAATRALLDSVAGGPVA